MPEMSREDYRNRIAPGMIVYYIGEQSGYHGMPNDKIVVKKGTVTDDLPPERRYPIVRIWKDITVEPQTGLELTMSPRQMFTAQEIAHLLSENPDAVDLADRSIDELVADDTTNEALTAILGVETMVRLVEDGLHSPRNPEY